MSLRTTDFRTQFALVGSLGMSSHSRISSHHRAHAVRELPQRAAGYDCEKDATVERRPEAVGVALVGRTAGYLPSWTVGQWSPVTGQRWNERRGGDPRTDHVTKGADSELLGWQPTETAPQLPLVNKKRYSQVSVGGLPQLFSFTETASDITVGLLPR